MLKNRRHAIKHKYPAMPKPPKTSDDPAERRRRAELHLSSQPARSAANQTAADSQRQLHELEVHQIELEMQNEELKEARDKLEALLEKFTDLYDFAPVGYLTLDRAGAICEVNLTGASLLRIARSALVNRRFGFFVTPADRPVFTAFLTQVFQSRIREECDVRLLLEGEHPVDVRMRANIIESGETCRVAITDITEHKRAEADRLILNKLESTGILAGGIAHDFNNLLSVIVLNLEMAQMRNPPDEELMDHLEVAKKTALMARSLTAMFVTFAHGGTPVRRTMLLAGLIRDSVRPAFSGSNVRCEFSLAEDLWPADVDAGQIGQVIRGMALNAREAMPNGGVVSVRAANLVLNDHEAPGLPAGEYVRVSIADPGTGIAKDVLPKIFDPYFSTKQRGNQKGMGLGLTICHSVVQKHQGTITVDSAVGRGTTFHIYLPAVQKTNSDVSAPAATHIRLHQRILVMDDEAALRKVLGATLQRMGHEVELAEDGQSVIEAYKNAKLLKRPFDAVILDLMVAGGMGGQDAMQALLQIDPAVNAVVMSGYANEPVILEYGRHGFRGALTKPFNHEKLNEVLSKVLEADSK